MSVYAPGHALGPHAVPARARPHRPKVIVLPRRCFGRCVSEITFPEMGVFFISREPVRHAEPIRAFADVRAALKRAFRDVVIAGSLSVNLANRFAIAACPRGLGEVPESSIAEVYEYDPVRFQAMVIGLVEPPATTPVHWIAHRVNPQARVVAVVPTPPPLAEGVERHPFPRGYLGDPNTLLAIGRLVKGQRATFIERVGLVLVGADGAQLAQGLKEAVRPAQAAP
jgi:hypothetical protein